MKRKGRITIGVVVVILLCMIFTNPNKSDYTSWLREKHGIICTNNGLEINCKQLKDNNEIKINWMSGHVKNVGIYTIFEENYNDMDGNLIEIRGIGILKTLINL